MQRKYFFYATLLDAFQYFLTSENENAFQEFIDRINRKPFTSEAADKGTKFNEVIDALILAGNTLGGKELMDEYTEEENFYLFTYTPAKPEDKLPWKGYEFKKKIVEAIYDAVKWSHTQVYTEGTLQTSKGEVQLYGYIDNLAFGSPTDIKTTSNYTFPKYLHNWQHIVYPYCLIQQGVQEDAARLFTYEVTDFSNTYREDYYYDADRDIRRLKNHCEHLIDFIEQHRDLITDTKIFTGIKTDVALAEFDKEVGATIISNG